MVKILRFRFQRNSKRRERWKKQKTMAHCEYFAVSWLALNVWWWWWKGPLILKRVSMKRQFNLESRGLLFISFGQISIHRTIIFEGNRRFPFQRNESWKLIYTIPYHTTPKPFQDSLVNVVVIWCLRTINRSNVKKTDDDGEICTVYTYIVFGNSLVPFAVVDFDGPTRILQCFLCGAYRFDCFSVESLCFIDSMMYTHKDNIHNNNFMNCNTFYVFDRFSFNRERIEKKSNMRFIFFFSIVSDELFTFGFCSA